MPVFEKNLILVQFLKKGVEIRVRLSNGMKANTLVYVQFQNKNFRLEELQLILLTCKRMIA